MSPHFYRVLAPLSRGYSRLRGRLPMCYSPVCHYPKKPKLKGIVRLACLRHAASVHPELGSNSQKYDNKVYHGLYNYFERFRFKTGSPPEADPPLAENSQKCDNKVYHGHYWRFPKKGIKIELTILSLFSCQISFSSFLKEEKTGKFHCLLNYILKYF